jgi:hypothetical protein
MATLAKLLQVDMGLPEMAKRLASAGRGKDSILAHINPKEAKLLKKHGGRGSINPNTGVMEFDDTDYSDYGPAPTETSNNMFAANPAPEPTTAAPPTPAPTYTQPAPPAPAPNSNAPDNIDVGGGFNPAFGGPTPRTMQGPTTPTTQAEPSFLDQVNKFGQKADVLNKALTPLAPYARLGSQIFGGVQGLKAQKEGTQQAQANEAEIRTLAEPYRQKAAQINQQGQQLLQAGQAGQLTAPQQQRLEAQRAQIMQQMAQSGQGGGTAEAQAEAILSRQASQYAQDNVTQGIALLNQANTISGIADKYITDAISTGYSQSADASKLANEFYQALGFSLPETQTKPPAQG